MNLKELVMPLRIRLLPRDEKDRPVPWFVAWVEGVPDFRVVEGGRLVEAVRENRCWICGQRLGVYLAFVIGPMCAVNRVSSEPPSHRSCAEYAAQACPFLSTPKMHRRPEDLPDECEEPAGNMIARNPGVTLIWVTGRYWTVRAPGGVLFQIDEPTEVLWFCEGRHATRAEVMHSIDTGLPFLEELASKEGPAAVDALAKQYKRALALVPA